MKKLIFVLCLVASSAFAQVAQPATPVQQTATMANASIQCTNATGSAQQTLTITPPSGQYVYVTNVDIVHTSTTAPAASLVTTTSTNLAGIKWYAGLPATATGVATNWIAGQPLKSTVAGTAVTIVSNAAITNVVYNLNACYFFAL